VAYELIIESRAEKELHQLRHNPNYRRIQTSVLALADDPRPPGCKKLSVRQAWRIRVGDYRIIYQVSDVVRIVTVQRVAHRGAVYDD
jgi:mRNA interferase RelE/StbE